MAIPVKAMLAGAATIGVGATGVGMVSTFGMPEWRPLVQDTGFWNSSNVHSDYTGKYGEKYARLLVGVGEAKSEAKVKDNKDWGDWAYKNLYVPEGAKGKFQDLNTGSKHRI